MTDGAHCWTLVYVYVVVFAHLQQWNTVERASTSTNNTIQVYEHGMHVLFAFFDLTSL